MIKKLTNILLKIFFSDKSLIKMNKLFLVLIMVHFCHADYVYYYQLSNNYLQIVGDYTDKIGIYVYSDYSNNLNCTLTLTKFDQITIIYRNETKNCIFENEFLCGYNNYTIDIYSKITPTIITFAYECGSCEYSCKSAYWLPFAALPFLVAFIFAAVCQCIVCIKNNFVITNDGSDNA